MQTDIDYNTLFSIADKDTVDDLEYMHKFGYCTPISGDVLRTAGVK